MADNTSDDEKAKPAPLGDGGLTKPAPLGDGGATKPAPLGDGGATKPAPLGDGGLTKPAPLGDGALAECLRRADGLLSTGEMARVCGSTLRTVRFYEEAGLLEPSGRSDGGHRLFEPDELEKLQLILDLREAGLSLADIRALFELKQSAPTAEAASAKMAEILGRQIDEMQKKIAKLRCLREELASTISVIQECGSCTGARFPKSCGSCDVMTRQGLPRAARLLWE